MSQEPACSLEINYKGIFLTAHFLSEAGSTPMPP